MMEKDHYPDSFPIHRPSRLIERRLLLFVSVVFLTGIYILRQNLGRPDYDPTVAGLVIFISFWVVHAILAARGESGDEVLIPVTLFIVSIGWLMVFRLYPWFAYKQMWWILVGEGVFLAWLHFVRDYRVLEDYKYLFLVCAVILQVSVALFGHEVNGAKLWFRFKWFSIQPVEFVKIFITIFIVSYLKQNREILERPLSGKSSSLYKYFIPLFVLWGIAESVLVIQKDLGMAMLLFGVFMGLFFVTTRKGILTFSGFALAAAAGVILYNMFPHVQSRINSWWNPWANPEGAGYQLIQAQYSLGNGGLLGAGLGRGQPFYIPAVHTDYIFVAIGEELGLVGCLVLIAAFLVIIQRMFKSSVHAGDEFSMLLGHGLAVLFATQVFVIIAGAVKLIPLTGITLPFVSYGGSSLVSNFLMLGIFMQISGREGKADGDGDTD